MSTVTAIAPASAAIIHMEWTEDQRALIKRTVAPDATNDELAMFLHVAAKAGLDPLQKQIWFVKRKQNVGTRENPRWEDRVTIQAGVDGLQARALRMADCEGIQAAAVYAKDDFVFDKAKGEVVRHLGNPFGEVGALVGAWAIVRRAGKTPFVALVKFSEYHDDRSFLWKNKPSVMIEKVARSTALRRAYPEAFGGIYDPAEMGRDASPEASKAGEGDALPPASTPVPALPAASEPEAARAVAVEVPAESPRPAVPPPHVAALWAKAKAQFGPKAQAKFAAAATTVFGAEAKRSSEWTVAETLDVEHALFQTDDLAF